VWWGWGALLCFCLHALHALAFAISMAIAGRWDGVGFPQGPLGGCPRVHFEAGSDYFGLLFV